MHSDMEGVVEKLATKNGGKIVLLVADGLGGLPDPKTGLTELETARTPNLDALAAEGVTGLHLPMPPGITPGSGPAHMALFGYDPIRYEIGRGVLEALGIGFDLWKGDVAVRLNFATVDGEGRLTDRRAGRIPTEKCVELAAKLDAIELPGVQKFVRPVKEHRAALVLRGGGLAGGIADTDPQRTGVPPLPVVAATKEQEKTAALLTLFLEKSRGILKGEPKANALTMRGIAMRDSIPTFEERFKLNAAAIAEYPMYRGVAGLVGMKVLPGVDSPEAIAQVLKGAFADYDFFFVHFKKTDTMGEDGNFEGKVAACERLDALIPSVVAVNPDVLVVTGDHSTPSCLGSHSWHAVPVLICGRSARRDAVRAFGESACLAGGLGTIRAVDVMPLALAHAGRLAKFGA